MNFRSTLISYFPRHYWPCRRLEISHLRPAEQDVATEEVADVDYS